MWLLRNMCLICVIYTMGPRYTALVNNESAMVFLTTYSADRLLFLAEQPFLFFVHTRNAPTSGSLWFIFLLV